MGRVKKALIVFGGGTLLFFLLLGIIASKAGQSTQNPSPSPQVEGTQTLLPSPTSGQGQVKVTRVIDGDTIEIEGGKRVRLIGIDTPELNKSGETGCFGREAFDYADKLLKGQAVRLEKDISETDRYGRLLRYIYLGDVFINDKLVREGYARVYTYPPDVKYSEQFRQAENEARENNRGLWSACQKETQATSKPALTNQGTALDSYTCDCSKTCKEISSCAEAQYQLKTCGCTKRDADGDGIACDGAPLNCQQ